MLRDPGIDYIESKDVFLSGAGLGVILVDEKYPAYPGDVRNASAYPYNIQYDIAKGLTIQELVREKNQDVFLPSVIEAAKRLQEKGCKAILGECGYFAYYQKQVAAAIDVPVFLTSLLQISWAQSVIGPDKVVGIICASKKFMQPKALENVGVKLDSNYVLFGARDDGHCPELGLLWDVRTRVGKPRCHFETAKKEFLARVYEFYDSTPNMGAMVFECTGFPPFAREAQRRIGIPIYSWCTLMDYAYSVTVHRDFYGHV